MFVWRRVLSNKIEDVRPGIYISTSGSLPSSTDVNSRVVMGKGATRVLHGLTWNI